jgi:hypothetical protein
MDPVTIGLIGFGIYLFSRSSSNQFSYKKIDGSWRAYFKGAPPSNSHILHDRYGYYVCWDRPLKSEKEARQVAEQWRKIYG